MQNIHLRGESLFPRKSTVTLSIDPDQKAYAFRSPCGSLKKFFSSSIPDPVRKLSG